MEVRTSSSVIACVSRAARELAPAVALLTNPARLAEQGRLSVGSSAHHVEIGLTGAVPEANAWLSEA